MMLFYVHYFVQFCVIFSCIVWLFIMFSTVLHFVFLCCIVLRYLFCIILYHIILHIVIQTTDRYLHFDSIPSLLNSKHSIYARTNLMYLHGTDNTGSRCIAQKATICCLAGPTGSGKKTLMQAIAYDLGRCVHTCVRTLCA